MSDPEYLTAPALAAKLGVSPYTIGRWRREGKGPPSVRVGATIRYRPESVAEWASEQENARRAPEVTT